MSGEQASWVPLCRPQWPPDVPVERRPVADLPSRCVESWAIWRPPWAGWLSGGWSVRPGQPPAGRRPHAAGPRRTPPLEPEVLRRSTTGYLVIDQRAGRC